MSIQELGSAIIPILKAHGVTRASIFGSAARDEMNSKSDIDIAVEMGSGIGLLEFIGLKQTLEERLGTSVDLVEYQAIKPTLKEKIIRESIPIL